jgi:hypothetical protein
MTRHWFDEERWVLARGVPGKTDLPVHAAVSGVAGKQADVLHDEFHAAEANIAVAAAFALDSSILVA